MSYPPSRLVQTHPQPQRLPLSSGFPFTAEQEGDLQLEVRIEGAEGTPCLGVASAPAPQQAVHLEAGERPRQGRRRHLRDCRGLAGLRVQVL